jgi:Arc/MetJ-type ribon-helix-helix transcriptional regulator
MGAANEEERIAVRCTRRELQHLDSFVVSGEFATRSELIRAALRDFLARRARSEPALASKPSPEPTAVPTPEGSFVPLRRDEMETIAAYGRLVANGAALEDMLSQLVRRGALELKVEELVAKHRSQVHSAAERRTHEEELQRTSQKLERRGILGP